MKIPETQSNVGAYYGNEENGQWQPNGVIIDSGVGGGVVGSGDAGVRPYPPHMPRGHVPAGYVMAGPYYPQTFAPTPDDFADYMWMENEEEFDKQVMQQLEEEALMEQCIEAMLEDEQRERRNGHQNPTTSNGNPSLSLEETVSRSTLNPLAAEFVPTGARAPPEDKPSQPEAPSPDAPKAETVAPEPSRVPSEEPEGGSTEEPAPPEDPPEVSAAEVADRRPKDKKDTKKPLKNDVKPKAKSQAVKSETKVAPKKKEAKVVKSEVKVESRTEDKPEEISADVPKAQSTPQPAPVTEEPPSSGFKPINYAAAARANKPKPKATTPPAIDKITTPPLKADKKPEKTEKKDKPVAPKSKTDKPAVQRKNSTK